MLDFTNAKRNKRQPPSEDKTNTRSTMKWIPNPDYEKAEEMVFLFNEQVYSEAMTENFGHAAHCRCCGYLTNGRKDGLPRCQRCRDNLVTFTDNL